jgi:hypothetical protein
MRWFAPSVVAPVSADDEGAVHRILELRVTITKLAARLGASGLRLGVAAEADVHSLDVGAAGW